MYQQQDSQRFAVRHILREVSNHPQQLDEIFIGPLFKSEALLQSWIVSRSPCMSPLTPNAKFILLLQATLWHVQSLGIARGHERIMGCPLSGRPQHRAGADVLLGKGSVAFQNVRPLHSWALASEAVVYSNPPAVCNRIYSSISMNLLLQRYTQYSRLPS